MFARDGFGLEMWLEQIGSSMKSLPRPMPELSRPLHVEKVGIGGIREDIVARPTERAALAKRFDLLALDKLTAQLEVDQTHAGKMLAVTGSFSADVVQQCVVTLEPLPQQIMETIDALFAPASLLENGSGSPHFDNGPEDDPEPYENGVIDLGELVAQHLGLALDPYPRKPGLPLVEHEFGAPAEKVTKTNPFTLLKGRNDEGSKS